MNNTLAKKQVSLALLLAAAVSMQYGCNGGDDKKASNAADTNQAAQANTAPANAGGAIVITEADYIKAAKEAYPYNGDEAFNERVVNDKTLTICNATKDQPSDAQAKEILDFEQSRIQYPADGNMYGDWKKGKFTAEDTHGGRIGFADFDDPSHPNGANCYACHAIDPNFPGAGNMGPSLTSYGLRGKSPEMIKYTYDKIYSAKASNPCSLMPRFGGKGHLLTPDQVADITAFLLDPESPVNQPVKTN
ncbi:MAG: sulfur oxidation c-type cytochrome SoxX [Proteobacteria bacterium]|nr:sulfur oxidation c-type cytochrome SoxX [Pseudomonadota bacterium]